MKKLIVLTVFILFSGIVFSQTLQKGSILGVHHLTITLKPDVTMNQFLDFFTKKWIPGVEGNLDGWKAVIVKSFKGEHVNEYGIVWYIESMKHHDKYYNKDGSQTDEMKAAFEKNQPINDELEKLGTWTSTFTDWVVQ